MDNKGQVKIGFIIVSVVAILVGLALYSGTFAENIGTMTKTSATINKSFTMPAVGSSSELTMCGQKALTYSIVNATDHINIPTTNYTITQSTGVDGYLTAKVTTAAGGFGSKAVNVTCTYEPKGYITDSGSRGIVAIIAIFMAILIMIAAMPNIRDKLFDAIRS